jgi:hypothetical protein
MEVEDIEVYRLFATSDPKDRAHSTFFGHEDPHLDAVTSKVGFVHTAPYTGGLIQLFFG